MATTPMNMYQMFIKPQRDSNKEFKERQNAACRKYMKKTFHEKYPNDPEFKQKALDASRNRYHNNEAYKEEKKKKARERYYRLKDEKLNKEAEDKALEFFRNLF